MKYLLLVAAILLFSCKKASTATNTQSSKDTVNIKATASIQLITSYSTSFKEVQVNGNTNPTIQNYFVSCSISYDIYDSTIFKYHKSLTQIQLPGYRNDTISNLIINPVFLNVKVDTVNYSQSSVPDNYYIIFNY